MKVLVTGAGGFIGRHVVARLAAEAGVELTLVGRTVEKLAGLPGNHVAYDVMQVPEEGLFERLGRPDKMVHLAWSELTNFKSSAHLVAVLPGHIRFLEALLKQGLTDLTVTGTCLEYGLQEGELAEDVPTAPVTAYGIAKDALHRMLVSLQESQNYTLKWLRPFYMWGEGQNPKSFFPLLDAALARGDSRFDMSGGAQQRDFLPVEEMGRRIAVTALQDKVTGAINIGSGKPATMRELAEARIAARGSSLELNLGVYPYTTYEPMAFWADLRKFRLIEAQA